MDNAEKRAAALQITEQLTELETAIANLELQRGSLAPDTSIGRISRMEAIEAASVNSTKMANYQRHVQALKNALTRLDSDPDFGYCDECGEPIAAARLALIPEATHCVKCAE